jgi:hypothetical protein
MSGNDDTAGTTDDPNVDGSLKETADHTRGGVADDPSSADSLVFTVPIDGEGGPRG